MTTQRKAPKPKGLSNDAVKGLALGALGSAEVVPIEKINVDPDYQRDLRYDLVNEIAKQYDIVKAGPILLSERADHTLWCVDGQHRMVGALQAGETEIFAHVVHGLTQEQEAELRLARNNRRGDTAQEKFRTRLVMGDPKAHAIMEALGQLGTTINLSPQMATGINAIATVEVLWDVDGKGTWLVRTMKVISEAWGADRINPETASSSMLKSVAWFISQHIDSREVPAAEFLSRLSANGVEDIRRKAVSHKAAQGGSFWINHYRALVEMWNYRRQDKSKIRWKTIGSMAQLADPSHRNTLKNLRDKGAQQ